MLSYDLPCVNHVMYLHPDMLSQTTLTILGILRDNPTSACLTTMPFIVYGSQNRSTQDETYGSIIYLENNRLDEDRMTNDLKEDIADLLYFIRYALYHGYTVLCIDPYTSKAWNQPDPQVRPFRPNEPVSVPETTTELTLSYVHVHPEVLRRLSDTGIPGAAVYLKDDIGLYVRVIDSDTFESEVSGGPYKTSLLPIWNLMKTTGSNLLCLDNDVPYGAGLRIFHYN